MKTFRSLYIFEGTGPGFYFNVYIEKDGDKFGEWIERFDDLAAILTYMSKNGWEYMSHNEVYHNEGRLAYKGLFYQETK